MFRTRIQRRIENPVKHLKWSSLQIYLSPENPSLFSPKAPSYIIDTRPEYQKLLYTNMQGKANTYTKCKVNTARKASSLVKTPKNWCDQIVRTAILKCSEKKLFLSFQGNMCGGDHSHPGVQLAAWNANREKLHPRYFLATYLKLLTTSILPLEQLQSAARQATTSTARYYLANIDSNVLLNVIIAYHYQHTFINQCCSSWSL